MSYITANSVPDLWNAMAADHRLVILTRLGWRTRADKPMRLALKCSTAQWDKLSPAMQNILIHDMLDVKTSPAASEPSANR